MSIRAFVASVVYRMRAFVASIREYSYIASSIRECSYVASSVRTSHESVGVVNDTIGVVMMMELLKLNGDLG